MASLPPYIAKLIDSDGYEDKKYFETKAAAEKWILGEGKAKFDGDVERAEIHHLDSGLIWSRDRVKVEDDIRYRQMRSSPDSLLGVYGLPEEKPKPSVEAYCEACQRPTMNWREYEERYGRLLSDKPLLRCSECYKVVPDDAPKP